MPVDNRWAHRYGRGVLRTVTILLAALLLLAMGVEASCWVGSGDEDHCNPAQCSFCTQCAVVTLGASPLILPNRATSMVTDNPTEPLSPDLGRLTPPPRF
jgi:hypothetical protein